MALNITIPEGGYRATVAAQIVKDAGLLEAFTRANPSPFGAGCPSALAMTSLEHLRDAVDTSLAACEALRGLILEELAQGPASFSLPRLEPEHHQLISAFGLVVLADATWRKLTQLIALSPPEGELELDGLPELLANQADPVALLTTLLKLSAAYAKLQQQRPSASSSTRPRPDVELAAAIASFLALARAATLTLSRQSATRSLLAALESHEVRIAGYPYRGLHARELAERAHGILPVRPADIVGNTTFLEAGMRLARDVAAFDMTLGKNPKRVNPILFGLGKPGCGKTVTAHAVGNYFLDFCAQRQIPARFIVIQRTDWASSYQNASASNLVRIFREEVYGFDGVCGVYWPDIDTAFASRQSGQLRAEEKQNLGAVFGIFDGTLLPKDGKWFMLCDANTLHMDEATISRIAQNPMTVEGPTTPEHYAAMMRDLMLKDVAEFLSLDEAAWLAVGQQAASLELSGRNVEAICNNLRAHIQDFELPDDYFSADSATRASIIKRLSRTATYEHLSQYIRDWVTFKQDAERRGEEERFGEEVESIVRRLNASELAAHLRQSPNLSTE